MSVAWAYPSTRTAWRSYALAGVRWVVVGAVGIALALVVSALTVSASRALLAEGAATTGSVTAADPTSVSYTYDADGEQYAETLTVVSGTSYAVGQEVEVRFDADDPETSRLVAEPRQVPLLGPVVVALVVAGASAVPIGVGVLSRARRWRSALRRAPWQPARLRMAGTRLWLDTGDGDPVEAKLLSTTRWRTKTLLALDGREVTAAFVGPTVVLTADGTDTPYGARR